MEQDPVKVGYNSLGIYEFSISQYLPSCQIFDGEYICQSDNHEEAVERILFQEEEKAYDLKFSYNGAFLECVRHSGGKHPPDELIFFSIYLHRFPLQPRFTFLSFAISQAIAATISSMPNTLVVHISPRFCLLPGLQIKHLFN